MNYTLVTVFSFSIFIAAVMAIFRVKNMEKSYYPFVFLIWLGSINEFLNYLLEYSHYQTILNNNIYSLLESILFTWFYMKQPFFYKLKGFFRLLLILFCLSWIVEMILTRDSRMVAYFSIFYSLAIVLLSISAINHLLVTYNKSLLKNALFWICIGCIAFFTFDILVNAFWVYGLNKRSFLIGIAYIIVYVNLITNLIFAAAVLWIPRIQPSLLL